MPKYPARKRKEPSAKRHLLDTVELREARNEGTQEALDNVTQLRQSIPYEEVVPPLPLRGPAPLNEAFSEARGQRNSAWNAMFANASSTTAGRLMQGMALPDCFIYPLENMKQLINLQHQCMQVWMESVHNLMLIRFPYWESQSKSR